jgi:hypothetical protein
MMTMMMKKGSESCREKCMKSLKVLIVCNSCSFCLTLPLFRSFMGCDTVYCNKTAESYDNFSRWLPLAVTVVEEKEDWPSYSKNRLEWEN